MPVPAPAWGKRRATMTAADNTLRRSMPPGRPRRPASGGLGQIRHHVRRWVLPVVALWAVTLVLNVLAPCCEAIASVIPHEHVASASGDHGHTAPPGEHEHCPSLDKVDNGLTDTFVHQVEYQPVMLPPQDSAHSGPSRVARARGWGFAATLQQTGPPVYLSTQRFRI